MTHASAPFWTTKSLHEMSKAEWESLCDGCGRCCLHKLEDEETGEIFWTDIACTLLDMGSCRCSHYETRHSYVPHCVVLTPDEVLNGTLTALPPSCAYSLLAHGKDLPSWHPLISGTRASVHKAGVSVRGRCISEAGYPDDAFEERIVDWPGEMP